jgi:hypothetical protein
VRNLPAQLPAPDQAGLFAALGDEAAATDDNTAAAEAYRTAHQLTATAGDVRAAAALVPRMVAVAHLLGTGLDARVGTLQAALDSLEGVVGTDRERARLHSAMAAAYLVDDRLDEAISHGNAAARRASESVMTRLLSTPPLPSDRCWSSPAGWMKAGSCSKRQ